MGQCRPLLPLQGAERSHGAGLGGRLATCRAGVYWRVHAPALHERLRPQWLLWAEGFSRPARSTLPPSSLFQHISAHTNSSMHPHVVPQGADKALVQSSPQYPAAHMYAVSHSQVRGRNHSPAGFAAAQDRQEGLRREPQGPGAVVLRWKRGMASAARVRVSSTHITNPVGLMVSSP